MFPCQILCRLKPVDIYLVEAFVSALLHTCYHCVSYAKRVVLATQINSVFVLVLNSVDCVPFMCMHLSFAQVWDDVGTEGRAGSIWVVNSLHLMVATVGHDPPTGPFWDLKVRA